MKNTLAKNQIYSVHYTEGEIGDCEYCSKEHVPVGSIMDADHKFYNICEECSNAMEWYNSPD